MASFLTLQNVSFVLNNGQKLFDQINFQLTEKFSALVGPNGSGKSVLGKIMTQSLPATEGVVSTTAEISYIPQQWPGAPTDSIYEVLGIQNAIEAIARIETGAGLPDDFDTAEPWWNWQEKLRAASIIVDFEVPTHSNRTIGSYSGGEQFRIMWISALLHNADVYIFDEPTNHLDLDGRNKLNNWIHLTECQVIVITHDRDLLDKVEVIYELTNSGLHRHVGNFSHYYQSMHQRWDNQKEQLNKARREKKRVGKKTQEAFEKQQQRVAKGKLKAITKNWSALEKGGAIESASASQSRQATIKASRTSQAEAAVQNAQGKLEWFEPIGFELPNSKLSDRKVACRLEEIVSGFDKPLHASVTINIMGSQRLHIIGQNGVGKSVLLKTIMQQLPAISGESNICVPFASLAQHFYEFDRNLTAVENFLVSHPKLDEKSCRDRLAWLRLRNSKADIKFGALSGGEQLKVALAIKLLGAITPQLLILDEPTNHLDLDSIIALESALEVYQGGIILVSHDASFVSRLSLTHQLNLETGDYNLL